MSDVVQLFRDFFRRDFALFLGGSVICGSMLYFSDGLPQLTDVLGSPLLSAVVAGLVYVVGYATQALFEFLRVVSTEPIRKLGRFGSFVFKRMNRREWKDVPKELDFARAWTLLSDQERQLCERTIALKMLGSAVGPPAMLTGLACVLINCQIGVGLLWLTLGFVLVTVSRMKAAQQAELYHRASRNDSH